jgi:hypothetical protein
MLSPATWSTGNSIATPSPSDKEVSNINPTAEKSCHRVISSKV